MWDDAPAIPTFSKLLSLRASYPCGTTPLPIQLSQSCYLLDLVFLWDNGSATSVFSKLLSLRASSPCGMTPLPFQFSQSCYPSEPHSLVGRCLYHSNFFKATITQSLVFLWDVPTTLASSKLLSLRASSLCRIPKPFQLSQS